MPTGRSLRNPRVRLVNAHYSTYGAAIVAEMGIPFVQVVHNSYVWLDDRAIAKYRQADPHTSAYICVSAQVARLHRLGVGPLRRQDGGRLQRHRWQPARSGAVPAPRSTPG